MGVLAGGLLTLAILRHFAYVECRLNKGNAKVIRRVRGAFILGRPTDPTRACEIQIGGECRRFPEMGGKPWFLDAHYGGPAVLRSERACHERGAAWQLDCGNASTVRARFVATGGVAGSMPAHPRVPCIDHAEAYMLLSLGYQRNSTHAGDGECLSDGLTHPSQLGEKRLPGVLRLSQVLGEAGRAAWPERTRPGELGPFPWGHALGNANRRPTGGYRTRPKSECIECVRQRVPRKMHFIWLGSPLPNKYKRNIRHLLRLNPGYPAHLWTDHAVDLTSFGDAAVYHHNLSERRQTRRFRNWDLIERESNLAGKADYLRMEVVFLHGGIYMDTDTVGVRSFDSMGSLFAWPFVAHVPTGYRNICTLLEHEGRIKVARIR